MSPAFRLATPVVLCLGLVGRLAAQEAHDHHAEVLGRVAFPVSCNEEARTRFERAMTLLHSFWWEEGDRAFHGVAVTDTATKMRFPILSVQSPEKSLDSCATPLLVKAALSRRNPS